MKKLAVSTLSLALVGGSAAAQSPFFHPSVQPAPAQPPGQVMPVSYQQAPYQAPGGYVPVRVHFGGALTRDGIVPAAIYLQNNADRAAQPINQLPGVVPANRGATLAPSDNAVRTASLRRDAAALPTADCADGSCYTPIPYQPPHMDDYRRPLREPRGHAWYTSGEYLFWWTKPTDSPPLLQVGTRTFSLGDIYENQNNGGRVTLGHWLNCHAPVAIEASFLFLHENQNSFAASSNGDPVIARPLFDARGFPTSITIADGFVTGGAQIENYSRLWGYEVNLRREVCRFAGGHFDLLMGYRQLHLDEGLKVTDVTQFPSAPIALSDAVIRDVDEFGTHNQIFAGQLGAEAEVSWRRIYLDVWGKFGLGCNAQTVNVNGYTRVKGPPGLIGEQSLPGGILAQTTNIGKQRENQLTVVPEAGVNVGFRLAPNWRLSAGYSALFINNVVRPGDQIDPVVNTALIPFNGGIVGAAPLRPLPQFNESTYWAHGLNVQMEIRY